MTWHDSAACRGADPDLFFLPAAIPAEWPPGQLAEARSYCFTCPVRDRCLADAYELRDIYHGIRGGLTPAEMQAAGRAAPRGCKRCRGPIPADSSPLRQYCSGTCHAEVKREANARNGRKRTGLAA